MGIPTKTFFSTPSTELRAALPLQQYQFGRPMGRVFFVHASGSGGTTGGLSPATAVTTIDAGINLCSASVGDIVYVLAGHTESITGAAGIAMDTAGVTIIGDPTAVGRNRPKVTFTTANGASCDVSAANCKISGISFVNGKDGQTAMINVTAADCWIEDCEFQLGDACTQAALGILTTAAADRLIVRRNFMHGSSDAGVNDAIQIVGGDSIIIEDNIIVGAFSTNGAIYNVTTASTMLTIRRNALINKTADGNNKLIVMAATTTGIIADNRGGMIDSTCPAPITAAGMHWAGNWIANNVNAQSTLY